MSDHIEDRRAADEQAALEHGFLAGTLPEEDRRRAEAQAAAARQPSPSTQPVTATEIAKPIPVSAEPAAPIAPAFSINAAAHKRSEALVKQIGLTIPHVELAHWYELLTIWGHR